MCGFTRIFHLFTVFHLFSPAFTSSLLGLFCKFCVFLVMARKIPACSKNTWIQTWLTC